MPSKITDSKIYENMGPGFLMTLSVTFIKIETLNGTFLINKNLHTECQCI